MKIVNPATNVMIREVPEDTAESISQKFSRAKAAQLNWANKEINVRINCIKKFRDLVVQEQDELAQILTSEVGKPITQSVNEIKGAVKRIEFFLENAAKVLGDELVDKGELTEVIRHEPLGVIANISAWNYPYLVGVNVFVPALLAGNAVLYKPSEFSTLTGLAIGERLHKSGVPTDLFVVVVGAKNSGEELLKQPINGIFFTGSNATGASISEIASKKMIKVQLELGGKDPTYVCDDVNVKAAAESLADGAFYNCGQSCCSVERIYVHQKIYDEFINSFVETVKDFSVGDPKDSKTYVGPLARRAQIGVLENQIKDAIGKGAKVLTGGKKIERSGNYFSPTVLVNVNHTMTVMRDESFGPVIGIQRVSGDEEALLLMNDTSYGLTAGVYSKDQDRAEKILSRVNTGSVYWNCCDRVSPRLPWSGRGNSGIGLTLSTHGILTFTQPKAWHLKKNLG